MEHRNFFLLASTPYMAVVGTLYLFSYWQAFDINPFEYATLTDAIFTSIIPVCSVSFSVVAGILAIFLFGNGTSAAKRIELHFERNKPVPLSWYLPAIVVGLVAALSGEPSGLTFLAAAASLLCTEALYKSSFASQISGVRARLTIITIIATLPIIALTQGKQDAWSVSDGTRYFEVSFDSTSARYIGHLGGKFFLLEPDLATIKILPSDQSVIALEMHDPLPDLRATWNSLLKRVSQATRDYIRHHD